MRARLGTTDSTLPIRAEPVRHAPAQLLSARRRVSPFFDIRIGSRSACQRQLDANLAHDGLSKVNS